MELKVGDLCKHFKGTNLIEKNIYEIVAINVKYTGTKELDTSELVVYRPLFQEGLFFTREYEDLVSELSQEEQDMYHQLHRIDLLTDEEKLEINDDDFIAKKYEYINSKYKKKL